MFAVNEDISVEYLKRKDTILAHVLDSVFDGVYIVDRQRVILFWNRGAEAITGYSAEEVMDRCCSDNILNHIDENGHILCNTRCPLAQSMQSGKPLRAKVYPLHKSGRRFPVMTHVAPIRNAAGQIIAAIEVFRDISREEELRILQEKFNKIIRKYVSATTFDESMALAHSGGHEARIQSRDLTILYMDIVGFTPLSERHTPEQVVSMLNSFFGLCDVITKEKQGDIDKFIGDSIMAVFLDANDAVDASLKILLGAMPQFNRVRAGEGHEAINIRVGINSGIVMQGDIGTSDRKDLTVIGDVVNTTHRIERICEPNSVLISESTYARLSKANAARFAFHEEVMVKGKDEPVRVFTLAASGTNL